MQTFQKDLNDSLKIKKMPRMVEHTPIVTQTREIRVFKTQFEESVQKKKRGGFPDFKLFQGILQ